MAWSYDGAKRLPSIKVPFEPDCDERFEVLDDFERAIHVLGDVSGRKFLSLQITDNEAMTDEGKTTSILYAVTRHDEINDFSIIVPTHILNRNDKIWLPPVGTIDGFSKEYESDLIKSFRGIGTTALTELSMPHVAGLLSIDPTK